MRASAANQIADCLACRRTVEVADREFGLIHVQRRDRTTRTEVAGRPSHPAKPSISNPEALVRILANEVRPSTLSETANPA